MSKMSQILQKLMCGDIINMWNVKYVKMNLKRNTLIRGVVRIVAGVYLGSSLRRDINLAKREKYQKGDGYKAIREKGMNIDIDKNRKQKDWRCCDLLGMCRLALIVLRIEGSEIRNILNLEREEIKTI